MVPNTSTVATKALEIIAEEIGLAASDLEPGSDFVELGVDSLLSLTASSRLREELDLDIPSTLFADYPTVKDLTAFLRRNDDSAVSTRAPSTACPTPLVDSDSDGYETDDTEQTDPSDLDYKPDILDSFRCILAEEVGLPLDELKGTSDFAELGMDSLLSLTVLARLREELDLDLPPTLFVDNNSLDEVQAALGLSRGPIVKSKSETVHKVQHQPMVKIEKPVVSIREPSVLIEEVPSTVEIYRSSPTPPGMPKATSMLLQGNPKTALSTLFLFPDGSGSATSYAPLPPISPSGAVYGLNCPYMKAPSEMTCPLEALTAPYLTELRRRQPHGPYFLGGWSAGGICAFDAAQELTRCGETVERLILIDSPYPIGLEKLPPRLYDFFVSIKLFGDTEPPKWLIPHFLAFVDSLDKYRAEPFARGTGPKRTDIVWAKDGVCKNPGDPRPEPREDDPREMKWLLNNRTDFGPNGWDALVGGGECRVEVLADANHFSLMVGEKAAELAAFLERAMRD